MLGTGTTAAGAHANRTAQFSLHSLQLAGDGVLRVFDTRPLRVRRLTVAATNDAPYLKGVLELINSAIHVEGGTESFPCLLPRLRYRSRDLAVVAAGAELLTLDSGRLTHRASYNDFPLSPELFLKQPAASVQAFLTASNHSGGRSLSYTYVLPGARAQVRNSGAALTLANRHSLILAGETTVEANQFIYLLNASIYNFGTMRWQANTQVRWSAAGIVQSGACASIHPIVIILSATSLFSRLCAAADVVTNSIVNYGTMHKTVAFLTQAQAADTTFGDQFVNLCNFGLVRAFLLRTALPSWERLLTGGTHVCVQVNVSTAATDATGRGNLFLTAAATLSGRIVVGPQTNLKLGYFNILPAVCALRCC